MMLAETTAGVGPWTAGGFTTVRGLDPARRPYIGRGRQFGGTHPGGAMVAFADGSIRFLGESIDPQVFEALSTVAGGENIARRLGPIRPHEVERFNSRTSADSLLGGRVMRSPRLRFTMRAVAVASIAAVVLGVGIEAVRRRARICGDRAAYHAAECRRLAADGEARLRGAEADPAMQAVLSFDADRHRRASAWHADLEGRFRRAAWRPWQALPPESNRTALAPDPDEAVPRRPARAPGQPRPISHADARCVPVPALAIPAGGLGRRPGGRRGVVRGAGRHSPERPVRGVSASPGGGAVRRGERGEPHRPALGSRALPRPARVLGTRLRLPGLRPERGFPEHPGRSGRRPRGPTLARRSGRRRRAGHRSGWQFPRGRRGRQPRRP